MSTASKPSVPHSASPSSSSSSPFASTIKMLLVSHLVTFGVGVYMGKRIDAEELESYRRAHHVATETKWKKRLAVAAGLLTVVGITTAASLGGGGKQLNSKQT
mmetsp:Transcript_23480/g.32930  ORF Transcript_23480/g.32930 Transcript_23480/m.32930 type:complete len:103 (+) Transcript_23480:131-439(+)